MSDVSDSEGSKSEPGPPANEVVLLWSDIKLVASVIARHAPLSITLFAALAYASGYAARAAYLYYFDAYGALGIDPYEAMITGFFVSPLAMLLVGGAALAWFLLLERFPRASAISPLFTAVSWTFSSFLISGLICGFAAGASAQHNVDQKAFILENRTIVGVPIASDSQRVAVRIAPGQIALVKWDDVKIIRRITK